MGKKDKKNMINIFDAFYDSQIDNLQVLTKLLQDTKINYALEYLKNREWDIDDCMGLSLTEFSKKIYDDLCEELKKCNTLEEIMEVTEKFYFINREEYYG